jgi:prepilin-type N-terminal cleavage/methylation domain-containing protein
MEELTMFEKMVKMRNKKGFTLMELLIVVAIIAILVAVSIPIFTSQLEKAREQTDIANMRAAKSLAVATYLTGGTATNVTLASGATNVEGGFTANYDAANGVLVTTTPTTYGKGTAADGGCDDYMGYTKATAASGGYIIITVAKDGTVTEKWSTVKQ